MIVEASPATAEHGLAGSEQVIRGTDSWLIEQFSGREASQRYGRVFRVPQESAEGRRIRASRLVLRLIEDGIAEILSVDPGREMRESHPEIHRQFSGGFP